jgi:hypothetical protein
LTRNQSFETLPSSIHGLERTKQHPVLVENKETDREEGYLAGGQKT